MKDVVVDTCIIIDSFDKSSIFHSDCVNILQILMNNRAIIYEPTYAMIEIACVVKRLKAEGKYNLEWVFNSEKNGLVTKNIEINNDFLTDWFDPRLPYIKSGDYIFMCIANKLKIPIITNDKPLINACEKCDIQAYNSEDALKLLIGHE